MRGWVLDRLAVARGLAHGLARGLASQFFLLTQSSPDRSLSQDLHLSGVPFRYRRAWVHVIALGFMSVPEWSAMGESAERLVVFSAMLTSVALDALVAMYLSTMPLAVPSHLSRQEAVGSGASSAGGGGSSPSHELSADAYPFGFGFFAHSFQDVELEARFLDQLFRSSLRLSQGITWCGGVSVALYGLCVPGSRGALFPGVPLLLAFPVCRSYVLVSPMSNTAAARLINSRIVAAVGILMLVSFLVSGRMHPELVASQLSASGLFWVAAILMFCPVYYWLSCVEDSHRMVWSASSALLCVLMPQFSLAGRPTETFVMLAALIVGELFGYTLMQLHRNTWLRSHAGRRAAMAEERADRAEASAAMLAVERGADSRLNHLIKSKCGASLQLTWLLREQLRQAGFVGGGNAAGELSDVRRASCSSRRATAAAASGVLRLASAGPDEAGGAAAAAAATKGDETSVRALTAQLAESRAQLAAAEQLMAQHDALLSTMGTQLDGLMDWVHRRQVFVQLEAGTYITHCIVCDLRHEIDKVLVDGGVGGGAMPTTLTIDCDDCVLVDKNIVNIVMEEAMSNARKYSAPNAPITVVARLEKESARLGDGDEGSLLHVLIQNQNPHERPRLTDDECRRVFEPGYKAHCASALSDGVGLDSVAKACAVVGGQAYLTSSGDESGRTFTTFHVLLRARPSDGLSSPNMSASDLEQLAHACSPAEPPSSAGSTGASTAGSTPATSSPLPTQGTRLSEVAARAGGEMMSAAAGADAAGADAAGSVAASTAAGHGGSSAGDGHPKELICLAIDDDPFLRLSHALFFEHTLGADMRRSGAMGVSEAEVVAFCDVVMGRCNVDLSPLTARRPADVLFIDHDLGLGPQMMGSHLALRASQCGFPGLICVVTAASQCDRASILELPYIHIVVEKGFQPVELAKTIRRKLSKLHGRR